MIIRRGRPAAIPAPETDPRRVRLSEHFVLSDFLGCHSVYSRGYPNRFEYDSYSEHKLTNARALCQHALEPLMAQFGGVSVSYGYISPDLSARIVKYQDPDKPSHHRWDLGAAADVCFHKWVAGDFRHIVDLYAPGSVLGSPIALAHGLDRLDIPYSRLITYSESPYLCIAVSAAEVGRGRPRLAFYENRYEGRPKAKPSYRQYMTPAAKAAAFETLQEQGLEHPWEGAGYPTYHGGGHQQYQHRRVSKYTMVSDWLFDLKSVSNGEKNIPSLQLESVLDGFAAAGTVYDWMIEKWQVPRASIVQGYVSHLNSNLTEGSDWRNDVISFEVAPPASTPEAMDWIEQIDYLVGADFEMTAEGFIRVHVDVETVLQSKEF